MVLDIFSPPGAKKNQSGKRTTFRYPLPPSSFHKRVKDMLKWTSYSCSAYNYNPLEAFKSLIQHKNWKKKRTRVPLTPKIYGTFWPMNTLYEFNRSNSSFLPSFRAFTQWQGSIHLKVVSIPLGKNRFFWYLGPYI